MDKVRARRIAAELGGRSVAGWEVGEYLGNGASAVVVSAERAGNSAALKLIDPEMVERYGAAQQLARVERERELTGHTEPHLVKIFDGGRCADTGYLYVAMELVALPELTTMVPVFPRERIGAVIRQLAGAARFLETRNLAHRDIKPDNVLITRDCGRAVLLDLGVVRPIDLAGREDAGSGEALGNVLCIQDREDGYQPVQPERPIWLSTVHSAKGLEFRALHFAGAEHVKSFRAEQKRLA